MKFASKEDIAAPIDAVFDMVSDFDTFERAAMRRGAEVRRTDNLRQPGVGMSWKARFMLRGRERKLSITLSAYDRPNQMVFTGGSPDLDGEMVIDLVALSRRHTRMSVSLKLAPKTLAARLLLQSLKLARSNLNRKFHLRLADYAKNMEDRYNRSA
ncbi:SRPBCC family protein [Lutimaribacter sp. EGI FJ00015]|uniref:SRPBCC family protein n=1 Tax=Lutimaribacter degradans TaxID=2945989 RepID=A0ACC5ZUL4_9RHOB|nr:SRPBCC family protein [Lutimaribacter sp. EGI FJ00013]MCM2561810.1 SRPBCC family protein [Lutimaribacter sp. EGI FJ00013]MCO0613157.1 SRPBCC family protein [Lutimaribacter sp. EGI FJ00015]MCO0635643.1 SRPBCC family protein [Lutimaribacter sp. EGI FJ00014]